MSKNGSKRPLNAQRLRGEYELSGDILEMSQVDRAAHCLDWCAIHYPYEWVPWNWLWQAINGQRKCPQIKDKKVELLRARSSNIRAKLQKQFGRTATLSRELEAVRACVDDQDIMDSGEMEKHVERVDSATRSMIAVGALVDPAKLKSDTAAHKRLKDFYTESVMPTLKQIGSQRFQRRLLTPRREDRAKATDAEE